MNGQSLSPVWTLCSDLTEISLKTQHKEPLKKTDFFLFQVSESKRYPHFYFRLHPQTGNVLYCFNDFIWSHDSIIYRDAASVMSVRTYALLTLPKPYPIILLAFPVTHTHRHFRIRPAGRLLSAVTLQWWTIFQIDFKTVCKQAIFHPRLPIDF